LHKKAIILLLVLFFPISIIQTGCNTELVNTNPEQEEINGKTPAKKYAITLNKDSLKLAQQFLDYENVKYIKFSASVNGYGGYEKIVPADISNITSSSLTLGVPLIKEDIRFTLAGLDDNKNVVTAMEDQERIKGETEITIDWLTTSVFHLSSRINGMPSADILKIFIKQMTGYDDSKRFEPLYFDIKGLAKIINDNVGVPDKITEQMKKQIKNSIKVKVKGINPDSQGFGLKNISLISGDLDSKVLRISQDEFFVQGISPSIDKLDIYVNSDNTEFGNIIADIKPGILNEGFDITISKDNKPINPIPQTSVSSDTKPIDIIPVTSVTPSPKMTIQPNATVSVLPVPTSTMVNLPSPTANTIPSAIITPSPTISSKPSTQIVDYVSNTQYAEKLHVINIDGTDDIELSSGNFGDRIQWSPDSQKIAVLQGSKLYSPDWKKVISKDNETYVSNIDGTEKKKIDGEFYKFEWSPDGSRILVSESNGFYTINSDGTNKNYYRNDLYRLQNSYPHFSPDSSKILFTGGALKDIKVYSDSWKSWVFVMNSDFSNLVKLPVSDYSWGIQWFPDGKRILYNSCEGMKGVPGNENYESYNCNIYASNYDGTDAKKVISGKIPVSLSPDGSKIAFEKKDKNDFLIYTMNIDGTGLTKITSNNSENISYSEQFPTWSPDGRKIAFIREKHRKVGEHWSVVY
jgi:Tol biopolymer transport system component